MPLQHGVKHRVLNNDLSIRFIIDSALECVYFWESKPNSINTYGKVQYTILHYSPAQAPANAL